MDPISQGVLAATFSQVAAKKRKILPATFLGFFAGMAADMDVLIRSSADPLLFLEYHRQFTHSLLFIPVGALVVNSVLYLFFRRYFRWVEGYLICLFGYSTHALLDACTTYGTQLFWPFSSERIAWNSISIVDPLFTLPLLICAVLAGIKRSKKVVGFGVFWCFLYLTLGLIQKQRAINVGQAIAVSKGHIANRLSVKPSFGNLLLWKAIYEFDGYYHVDAIRLTSHSQHCGGAKALAFDLKKDLPTLSNDSQQFYDIKRFDIFSNGYLTFNSKKDLIIDARYSMIPNEFNALWGIIIKSNAPLTQYVTWWDSPPPTIEQRDKLLALLRGKGCYSLK